MTKFVAFLRGINVGGNAIIKMTDLKTAFEKNGFTNVKTYINSGNVIFESPETNITTITDRLEKNLTKTFNLDLKVVILNQHDLQKIADEAPANWKKPNQLRCYIAFIKAPITPEEILKEVKLNEKVDSAKIGKNVLYMSSQLDGLTRSGFTKMVGKSIYKSLTIRNFNTVQKLLEIINKTNLL